VTALLSEKLRSLAAVLDDLKERVRAALASELARAVSAAVQDVVQAVMTGGRPDPVRRPFDDPYRRTPYQPWRGEERDPWDDDREEWCEDRTDFDHTGPDAGDPDPAEPGRPAATAAVSAGTHVARWWLARRGTWLGALGVGLAVAVAGLAGGPAVRIGLGVLAAVADLATATDALGGGAAALAIA
jgi:hypothetical protein